MTLTELIDSATFSPSGLSVELPVAWTQGRTGYGGVTAALSLAAAQGLADGRPLRSAMIAFVGPSAGTLEVEAEVLRSGRNTSSIRSRLHSSSGPGVDALFTFSANRDSILDQPGGAAPLEAPAPDAQGLPFRDGAPEFTRHLEFLWAGDTIPFTGSDSAQVRAWVRHRDPASRDHPLALMCLADALPPAISMTA